MQKFKMAAKSGGKTIFGESCQNTLQIPCRSKIPSKALRFRDKHIFPFNADIQDGRQKWRENDFCEKSPIDSADTLRIKNFVEIGLSCSVSEINASLRLTQKFKMAAKSGRKTIFEKSRQLTPQISWESKISLKSHYLAPFSALSKIVMFFERNLAVMVIYVLVKFEFDRTNRF